MKQKVIILIILFPAAMQFCFGQDAKGTLPLKSSGLIPQENLTPSSQKYYESRKNIALELRRKDRLLLDKYYMETNYWIDDFQRGGKVLFGNAINQYIERITDTLLADRPDLRGRIHCYPVKSSVMNAFSTERGNVYVNLGLIAKMRTEAELASVLSHEINHYLKKHVLKGFIKQMDINLITKDRYIEENPGEDLLLKRHNYSQNMEFEADTAGFNMLAKTRYNINAAVSVCDLLVDADLPFDDKAIDKTFFETPLYSLPISLPDTSDSTVEKNTPKNEETHPAVPERRALLVEKLGEINSTSDTLYNRFNYTQPKALFDSIRMMARLELPRIMLSENRFEEAIYTAYLLQDIYPQNNYLEKVIAFALTGMMLQKTNPALADEGRAKYFTGRIKEVHGFFRGLSAREFNLVAIAYLLNAKSKHGDDIDYEMAFNSAVYNFVKNESDFINDKNSDANDKDFSSVLFGKLRMSGKTFADALEKQQAVVAKENELKEWYNNLTEKQKRALDKKKFLEKADKIIVLNPMSVVANYNNESYDFLGSEKNKVLYDKFFEKMAAQKKYKIELINPLTMNKEDVERFNDYATLNEWMESMLDFSDVKFNTSFEGELKKIPAKYNARYVLWCGTISVKYLKEISSDAVIASVIFPAIGAITMIPRISPDYYSVYFSVLMDLEKNKILYTEISKVSEGDPVRILKRKTDALLKRMF